MLLPHSRVYDEEHKPVQGECAALCCIEIAHDFSEAEDAGIIGDRLWSAGGEAGLLCPQVPEQFGGCGRRLSTQRD